MDYLCKQISSSYTKVIICLTQLRPAPFCSSIAPVVVDVKVLAVLQRSLPTASYRFAHQIITPNQHDFCLDWPAAGDRFLFAMSVTRQSGSLAIGHSLGTRASAEDHRLGIARVGSGIFNNDIWADGGAYLYQLDLERTVERTVEDMAEDTGE